MKEFWIYTVARIGLFIASYAVVAGIYMLLTGSSHVPILWPFLVAMVISAVASYYLLRGPRARFAAKVEQRASRAASALEQVRSKEDRD